MGTVRVGTSGFCVRPHEYAETFPVVELPHTGPRLVSLITAQRWRAEAPEAFEFVLRAPRIITHGAGVARRGRGRSGNRVGTGPFQDTPTVRRAWAATLDLARVLEAKLVVFPCPASFRPDDENIASLHRFFQWAHRDRLRLGWEPRGEAWGDVLVRELCRELSLTHVVDPFVRPSMRPRPACFHLRGRDGHGAAYSDEDLARLRDLCPSPLAYCIFSNPSMRHDAERFTRLFQGPFPIARRSG